MDYLKDINIGFIKCVINDIIVYKVPSFEPYVDFAFCGDISNNLSFKAIRGTDTAKMRSSFTALCNALNMPYEDAVMTNIVHGKDVITVNESHKGLGVSLDETLPPCDGIITKTKNIPIATTHADCMPIAFCDKEQNIGCVVHAGWRGVLAGIHICSVERFFEEHGSSPENLLVAIGPTIHQCCFEVDKDVTESFKTAYSREDFILNCGEKDKLDLLKLVVISLLDKGIKAENITVDNRCTACKDSGLESFRRDKNNADTMVQIMCLR